MAYKKSLKIILVLALAAITAIYVSEIFLGLSFVHFEIFDRHKLTYENIFLFLMGILGLLGLIGVWLLFIFNKFSTRVRIMTGTFLVAGIISSISISIWSFSTEGIDGSVHEVASFLTTWGLLIFPIVTIFYSKKMFLNKLEPIKKPTIYKKTSSKLELAALIFGNIVSSIALVFEILMAIVIPQTLPLFTSVSSKRIGFETCVLLIFCITHLCWIIYYNHRFAVERKNKDVWRLIFVSLFTACLAVPLFILYYLFVANFVTPAAGHIYLLLTKQ